MAWNLPPGVTGLEPEIAGPESEEADERWCRRCEADRDGIVQSHGREAWFVCDICGDVGDLDSVDLLSAEEIDRRVGSRAWTNQGSVA